MSNENKPTNKDQSRPVQIQPRPIPTPKPSGGKTIPLSEGSSNSIKLSIK